MTLRRSSSLRTTGITVGKLWTARVRPGLGVLLTAVFAQSVPSAPTPPPGGPVLDSSQFHFRVSGAPGAAYVVEASADFVEWTPVFTNTVSSTGYFDFVETQAGNFPQRFYRTVPSLGPSQHPLDGFRQDRILVKPRSGAVLGTLAALHRSLGTQILQAYPNVGNLQVVRVPATSSLSDLITSYRQNGAVE